MKIIRIGASWCSSCLIMKSRFKEFLNDIEVIDYDYDFDEEEVEKYHVGDTLPVYIKQKNNQEVSRLIGEHSKEEIKQFLECDSDEKNN